MTGIHRPLYAPPEGRHERRALEAVEADLAQEFRHRHSAEEVHAAVMAAYEGLSWVRRRTYVPRLTAMVARQDLTARARRPRRGPVDARALVPSAHHGRPRARV